MAHRHLPLECLEVFERAKARIYAAVVGYGIATVALSGRALEERHEVKQIHPEPTQVVEPAFYFFQATGEAIDVETRARDVITQEPVALVQLLIVLILHRFWPLDKRSRNDRQKAREALSGFWM